MKNLKSLFSAALLAASSMMFAAQSNGAIITETVSIDGIDVASLTFELDDMLINSGMGQVYVLDDIGFDIIDFEVFFSAGIPQILNDIDASIDVDNLFAGIEFLSADIEDTYPGDVWFYQFSIDDYDAASNYFETFSEVDGYLPNLSAYGSIVTSRSFVDVSEPSILALFALALGGLVARRRA